MNFGTFCTLIVAGIVLEATWFIGNYIYTKIVIKDMSKDLMELGEDLGEQIQQYIK